jgi:hypothetical protein
MRAARVYGSVAPNAGHALHMTSHIFVAMGMWDEVIAANRRAIEVVNRQRAARSKPAVECGHYPIWLHYALLQKRRFEEASQALEACRASAFATPFTPAGEMDTREGRLASLAEMRAHQIAAGGAVAESYVVPAEPSYARARFMLAYGDLLAAARGSDQKGIAAAAARMRLLHEGGHAEGDAMAMGEDGGGHARAREEIMIRQADALQLAVAGRHAAAVAILEEQSKAERAMPYEFGPPAIPKPSPELLADEILAAGKADDAVRAYGVALARTPGRSATLEGLARARKESAAAGGKRD